MDLGVLTDGEIDLVAREREPANPEKGYVPQYHFWITLRGSPARIGALRFRVGTAEQLFFPGHLGYEVDLPHQGKHFAEKACHLVAPLVQAHGLRTVVLTCRPDNGASRRTIERLGGRLLGQFEVPPNHEMYPKYAKDGGTGGAPILRFEWTLPETTPRRVASEPTEGRHHASRP